MKTEYMIGAAVLAAAGGYWWWSQSKKKAASATTITNIAPKGLPYTAPGSSVPQQAVIITTSADAAGGGTSYTFPLTSVPSLAGLVGKSVVEATPMIASLGGVSSDSKGLTLAKGQAVLGNLCLVGLSVVGTGGGEASARALGFSSGGPLAGQTGGQHNRATDRIVGMGMVGQGAGNPGRLYNISG